MGLWTPAQLSSYCWIDFSDTSKLFDATSGGSNVTSGTGIARAEDKSGNARHFTQSTAGSRPTYTGNRQNGLGAAVYDGGDWLTSSSAASIWTFLHSTQATIFVVLKNGTTNNPLVGYGWFGTNGTSSTNIGVSFRYVDTEGLIGATDAFFPSCTLGVGNSFVYSGASATEIYSEFSNIFTPNVYQFYAIKSDPANATVTNRVKIAVNGGGLVGNQQRSDTLVTSNPTYTLQLGTAGNNVVPLTGDYLEWIAFDSLVSTSDQQRVEGYLAWKWGLQGNLPNGHPYKNAAPSIGSFDEGGMFGGISGGMTGGFAT